MFASKHTPCPTHACLHFISNEKNTLLLGYPAHCPQIP